MTVASGSPVRAVFDRARALEADGRSIVHLEIGRPHRDSPPAAKRAAIDALAAGHVHYTPNRGLPELRQAFAEVLRTQDGVGYDPETELIVTAGGSEAIAATFLGLLEPGDEVLVPSPAWPHYAPLIALAGATAVDVPCPASEGFVPDPDRLRAACRPRTRMLVLANPVNPTGVVIGAAALRAIGEVCVEHDLLAVADRIYARLVFDGAPPPLLAAFEGMHDRTIVCDSLSKSHCMTGWRIGYAAARADLAARIATVHQYVAVCATSFAQAGALAAIREGEAFVQSLVAEYRARRDEVVAAAAGWPGTTLVTPSGAFYAFPRIEVDGADGSSLAVEMLEQAGVAVVPGVAFGPDAAAHLRLSFAVDPDVLAEGLDRIGTLLRSRA